MESLQKSFSIILYYCKIAGNVLSPTGVLSILVDLIAQLIALSGITLLAICQ